MPTPSIDLAPFQAAAATTMQAEAVTGLVLAVAQGAGEPQLVALGHDAHGTRLSSTTCFPVASLSKLALALAVLRMVAKDRLQLDERLSTYLPEAQAAQPGVTLRRLLSHCGGLPVDVAPTAAPYAPGLNWPILAAACLATPLAQAPATRVIYSNVGYGLLALVIERVTGWPYRQALRELVLDPLGLTGSLGTVPSTPVAVLGGRLGEHTGTGLEPFNSLFWRELALPWAGLITDAAGALALVRAFGGQSSDFLPTDLVAEAQRDQTSGLAGGTPGFLEWPVCPWGLGPELRGHKWPHFTPTSAAPTSFGHAGGSGCLAWYDPPSGRSWAILATRTLPGWWLRWPNLAATLLQLA
ncbi:MAG: serine hydrolase domain-containing protein [Oscillochloridaceae bacterium umkhey_bin13]